MSKGPNFTPIEDFELCRAFVAASEDANVGTDQKSADFKLKMFEYYCKFINEYNDNFGSSYVLRQGHSNYQRFKKISKFALKWIGIEESAGDPPSGDTEKILWLKGIRDTFLERHQDGKNILENVLYCKEFLQQSPKWRSFEESAEGDGNKRKRPAGTKKSKQMKADLEVIQKLTGSTKQKKKKEKNMKKHLKAQRNFMQDASNGMSALVTVLAEQNEARLLEQMTPKSRNKMAKKMFTLKMQKYRDTPASSRVSLLSTSSSSEDEDEDSDAEDVCVRNRRANFKNYNEDGEVIEDAKEEDGSDGEESSEVFF
jgi:hypothetical protein